MNNLTRQLSKQPCWSIFLLTLLPLLALQYKPAILNYTTRFVDFTEYMLAHGITLFPVADNLQPYPDYTIANTFLEYLASLPFGRVSILSMGLPICMAASLMLVFVYKLGALHDRKWGVYAVFFSLFSWAFLDGVTYQSLDVYPALFTIIAFYLVYSDNLKLRQPRLALILLSMALGFAFRGPIGLIVPTVVLASYYSLSRQWRMLCYFLVLAGLLLFALLALLMGAAFLQGGKAFMMDVAIMQGLGRVTNEHGARYYFYFTLGLATYGITAFFALNVIFKKYSAFLHSPRESDTALLFYLATWLVAVLVLLTIPNSKKLRYIMSITPAIALLAGYIFVDKDGIFARTREQFLRLCLNLPMIGIGMVVVVFIYNFFAKVPLQPNYPGVLASCIALTLAAYLIKRRFAEHPRQELLVTVCGLVALFSVDAFLFNSIGYHLELAVEPTPKFLPYWFW